MPLEVLKSKERRRDLFSRIAYTLLNIVFALGVFVAIIVLKSPILAIGLLILSKWRVLAVKPRFWWANIQSNAVDFIVGVSYVIWLSQINPEHYWSQILVVLMYLGWLLFIKPKSDEKWVITQGLVSLYTGLSSLFIIGYEWNVALIVLVAALINFVVARHILSTKSFKDINFLAGFWALVGAELAWILNHWVVAYRIVLLPGIYLVQPAVISSLLLLGTWLVIDQLARTEKPSSWREFIKSRNAIVAALCLLTILVLLIILSKPLSGGL